MAANGIEKRLQGIIIPYLISARRLPKYPLYMTYEFYSMLNAYLAALVGFGIASPTLRLYEALSNTKLSQGQNLSLSSYGITALVGGAVLLALSVYFNKKNAGTRVVLATTCRHELQEVGDHLEEALQSEDPSTEITKLQNHATSIVQRYRSQHEAWPWERFANDINDEVLREVRSLSDRFGPWQASPERREPKVPEKKMREGDQNDAREI